MIHSILDNDLYKFTMQQAVLQKHPGVEVEYKFFNRDKSRKFTSEFVTTLRKHIDAFSELQLTETEYAWLKKECKFFSPAYLEYLKNYRYDPKEVSVSLDADSQLVLDIRGTWEKTILWEVSLMALISELYFLLADTDWHFDHKEYANHTDKKMSGMMKNVYADFGTRRRRSYEVHDCLVEHLKNSDIMFAGTSNVKLAQKYNIKPIGTCAHEWTMGISAIHGLRHANRFAMQDWTDVYHGALGVVLTDTFGTDSFFEDFDSLHARIYDGVRHDSGDPIQFAEKTINHYKSLGISPMTKKIVFSDSLNPKVCKEISAFCQDKIGCIFGIGTNLTNDKDYFAGSKPLNIVIKLTKCKGIPVVKLSDDSSKAIGDPSAVKVAKWTFFGEEL